MTDYQQKPRGYLERLSSRKRLYMLHLFSREFPSNSFSDVLNINVTTNEKAPATHHFEQYFPVKSKIIALSNQDATFLEDIYPGLVFKQGDARQLPFANESIDVIYSSASIEHMGSFENQKKMLAECFRVAKKGVFITTSNRWHPIELHRTLLKKNTFNKLNRKTLTKACEELGIHHFSFKRIKTFGLTSNLVLVIRK